MVRRASSSATNQLPSSVCRFKTFPASWTTVLPDGRVVQAVDPNREFQGILEARFVLMGEATVSGVWRGDGWHEPEDWFPGRTRGASLAADGTVSGVEVGG